MCCRLAKPGSARAYETHNKPEEVGQKQIAPVHEQYLMKHSFAN
jgi:hypothetical protein